MKTAIYDDGANAAPSSLRPGYFGRIFSTHHKTIGVQYLWLSLASVLVGMVLSALLRVQPASTFPFFSGFSAAPHGFATVRLLHGSLMVFFVLTAAPQLGLGNFLLPLQIGASDMAFPKLNRVSLWLTVIALVGIATSAFLITDSGINLWLMSAAVFSLAALFSALNFSITTIELRAQGMTLSRMPLTVWAWFVNAILSMLIFSVLLAGSTAILSDRIFGSNFVGAGGFWAGPLNSPMGQLNLELLWNRLFWYFAQAQVYVAMLPCFGIVTHLIATFSGKPVWKERLVVVALCGVGLIGFCVWGYHMFSTGMNPFAPLVFAVLASSLGVPATVLLASWLATLWNTRPAYNTAMLFCIGFISLFVAGGLSGIFLARHDLSAGIVSEDFVTGHFHLVMGVAATFAILAGLFFWFPKIFGRHLDETLGRVHFWMTFAGVYCVFMPMHWLGLLTQSNMMPYSHRAILDRAGPPIRTFIALATVWTVSAQILFVWNFFATLLRRRNAEENDPWQATTLEWSVASPAPRENFGGKSPVVYRGAYEWVSPSAEGLAPQYLSPELLAQKTR